MSDHIPFHIQEEIMKRLPVKSLVQFRSVSKAWKSLIDSSRFIAAHSLHSHTQPQHLLVYNCNPHDDANYVSYFDGDSFPQQRFVPTLPRSLKQLKLLRVVGSLRGLVCLYCSDADLPTRMAVLWNPVIRKLIVVAVPRYWSVAFGVCPATCDPKILLIKQSSWDVPEASYKCEVMVYTLSSGKWRSLSTNLPAKPLWELWSTVATDQFIYWLAVSRTHFMIMSFDVTNESFQVIDLPDSIASHCPMYISKLSESLAIVEYMENMCIVWVMEDGAQRSFTKLFTIKTPHKRNFILGFRKNGIPIVQVKDGESNDPNSDHFDKPFKLVVYEPNSEHNNVLEIAGSRGGGFPCLFGVNAYMETLHLLDRSDCISY